MKQYQGRVYLGFFAFFVARFFEVSTYYLVAKGIDQIGFILKESISELSLGLVTGGIVFCVFMRFVVVSYARRSIRRVGIVVSYDLRQRLYHSVLRQGMDFYARIPIGDVMTRAIQDIALIQRLIAFGLIAVVIMFFAPLFGVSAMLLKSTELTLLTL
ncbi:MAG: ABC transporter transmembrane domain-containing protein, partial [Pseudomonadales bacterium]|nr:ABC transporter transmembrane domain-containing protein [Pseudomonadales bacterium]